MNLVTPKAGLFAWTIFSLITLALFIPALLQLLAARFTRPGLKLAWLLAIWLPVVGPLLYFTYGRGMRDASR